MLTNSQKIKKILDGGNNVKVTYDNGMVEEFFSYDDEFLHSAGDSANIEYIDYKKISIGAVYKKPTFNNGDLVDYYENGAIYKKFVVVDVKNSGCDLEKEDEYIKNVPFWALSYNVDSKKDNKIKHVPLGTPSGKEWSKSVVTALNQVIDKINS